MLVFILNVCKVDWRLAVNRLGLLRSIYPEAPIISIADGWVPNSYQEICAHLGVKFIQEESVKAANTGGLWTHRYLEYGLRYNPEAIIRFDPDTAIFDRFEHIPADCDIFANLLTILDKTHIMGGCIGFKQKVAQTLVNSKILLQARYQKPEFTYTHVNYAFRLTSQDAILADVVQRLNLKLGCWDEVEVYPSGTVICPSKPYKAFHPCMGIVL